VDRDLRFLSSTTDSRSQTMGDDQGSAAASIASLPGGVSSSEVVLEGKLMKLSRNRQWQERYFVFHSNQVLTYSHIKEDASPRQCFRITRESGCEVGELHVEQRHNKGSEKKPLYCINVSWPDDNSADGSFHNNKFHDSFKDDVSFQEPLKGPSEPATPAATPRRSTRANAMLRTPLNGRPKRISRQWSAPVKGGQEVPYRNLSVERKIGSYDGSDEGDEHSISSLGTPNDHKGRFGWRRGHKERKSLSDAFNHSLPNLDFGSKLSKKAIPSVVNMNGDATSEDEHATIHELENEHEDGPQPPLKTRTKQSTQRQISEDSNGTTTSTGQPTFDGKNAAEQEKLLALYMDTQKKEKKEHRKKLVEGTKFAVAAGTVAGVGVLTAGVGLAAGLVFLGAAAAAGGTAGVAEAGFKRKWQKSGKLTIASTSFEQVKLWKSTLDACLESESLKDSTWGQLFVADGRKTSIALMPHDLEVSGSRSRDEKEAAPSQEFGQASALEPSKGQPRLFLKDRNFSGVSEARWRPLEGGWISFLGPGAQSLRIFREEKIRIKQTSEKVAQLAVSGSTCTPLKTQVVLKAPPLDAFMCLMSYARLSSQEDPLTPNSGQSASFRVLENIDDHTDIVHLICRKLYLFPSWTEPRDFVLFRYWRYEQDGSYTICYESIEHHACPPRPDFVRGDMHQACTIAPLKSFERRRTNTTMPGGHECLLTAVVQVDPKGWVPARPISFLANQSYADAFGVSALLQILDVRDAIDHDRFIDVSPDFQLSAPLSGAPKNDSSSQELINDFVNYDSRYANRELLCDSLRVDSSLAGLGSRPPPLNYKKWAEPDANSFLVRGPSYKKNRVKINAGASIGRLVAVDLVAVEKPLLTGMSTHPTERIQLGLERERKMKALGKKSDMPPFIFMVNILLPGPPPYHAVYYYAVDDMSTLDGTDGTGSSRLCQKFLFGDSDEFRDKTFKLIPQIVEGNFMVRKAVGSTPAIMGTKLHQTYVRSSRYLEVILNCGSSAVATGVIRLSLGYAKTLVVDMGFLLEADEEEYLPERIFGCVRMKKPEFGSLLRKVEVPEEVLR
jgi:hypothetical protein